MASGTYSSRFTSLEKPHESFVRSTARWAHSRFGAGDTPPYPVRRSNRVRRSLQRQRPGLVNNISRPEFSTIGPGLVDGPRRTRKSVRFG
jgi:hypothetical protein